MGGLFVHCWENNQLLFVMPSSPPPPPPPVVHVGKKSPTAAAASGDSAALVGGTDQAATAVNIETLRGKTFVQKIHAILAVPKYSSIISWNDAGNVAIIHDADAFISTIVPIYFKKTKFGSFIRKMRRWGFSALTKKGSSSERGESTVIEFSNEHFLRDQPDLCRLMKDERNNKKQFSFLDRHVRNVNQENVNEGSSIGVDAHYSPVSAPTNAANYPTEYQLSGVDNSVSPMISPHQQSFHNAMPVMNMMMPPHPPPPHQLHYSSPYGYSYSAPPPPGVGYGPPSPFRYPAPDVYSTYPQQPQHQLPHQMMHHNPQQNQLHNMMQQNVPQQQEQDQQQQQLQQQPYQMMQQHQQFPPSVNLTPKSYKMETATSNRPSGLAQARAASNATATGSVAVLTSSSEESTELLPNTKLDRNVQRLDSKPK